MVGEVLSRRCGVCCVSFSHSGHAVITMKTHD